MNAWEGIDDRVNIDKSCVNFSPAEWNEMEKAAMAAQMKIREESKQRKASWEQGKN